MTKVIGKFTAAVPGPIAVAPEILHFLNRLRAPDPLKLSFGESEILVNLGEQTEPMFNEYGDLDQLPIIKSFVVWITRDVSLQSDSTGQQTLPIEGSVCLWGVEFSSVTAEFPPCQKRVVWDRIAQRCLRL